jgi:hypothetical protein
MLSKDVLMEDIDIDQWRNAQNLLLESAKEKRRIIILHDQGIIRKCEHTEGCPVSGAPDRIVDAQAQAKQLYEDNRDSVDFVAIFERHAFDEYFSRVQGSWIVDEPLDSFVQRTYALLDCYANQLVTYPGPARTRLGLQYRLGVTRNEAAVLADRWLKPESSLLLGVYEENRLWASLVMTFDGQMNVTELTTVDAERVDIHGAMEEVVARCLQWTAEHHQPEAVALVWTRQAFEQFRQASDKESAVRHALLSGEAVLRRS